MNSVVFQIGGSLAKLVYFTRSPEPPSSPSVIATRSSTPLSFESSPRSASPSRESVKHTGALTPLILDTPHIANGFNLQDELVRDTILRRASQNFPGGSLRFERFETDNIEDCVEFIQSLIERSAKVNHVSIEEMRRSVHIMATGGGAHKFCELFGDRLMVDFRREDEMECLIEGLKFITLIPDEVYFFSDELIHSVSHPGNLGPTELERPSPNPPKYSVSFESHPSPQLPCLLVNIGSGVSIIRVDEDGSFERVSGTSLGGGTLWGLLSLLTPATTFDGKASSVILHSTELIPSQKCYAYLKAGRIQTWTCSSVTFMGKIMVNWD
jgi:type II pantothenate kinase